MICIYHNRDLDGFTSAAIVKKKYPEAELIGYDYGQPIPSIQELEDVIMVDVSIPMKEMEALASKAKRFTWIDHHRSAIKEWEEYFFNRQSNFASVLHDGLAACEITWQYLFPETPMPQAVRLLGQYDTWRKEDIAKWEHEILPFQFGMRERCNSPESFPMYVIDGPDAIEHVVDICRQGNTILKYQAKLNESQCSRNAFEIEFEGLRAICLNGGGFNSDVFKSVYDESKHDIMMPFQFNGKFWTISIYTTHDHIDCSAIAKSKGGGGHKKAAGFQTTDISFLINNK